MFEKLTAYLDLLEAPSADLIVMRDHQVIYRHLKGYADYQKAVPLTGNENL